jgi:hypothetical protein
MQLGEASRWHASQTAMPRDFVVAHFFDRRGHLVLRQTFESTFIQVLVMETAVDALDAAVLHDLLVQLNGGRVNLRRTAVAVAEEPHKTARAALGQIVLARLSSNRFMSRPVRAAYVSRTVAAGRLGAEHCSVPMQPYAAQTGRVAERVAWAGDHPARADHCAVARLGCQPGHADQLRRHAQQLEAARLDA